MEGGGGGGGGGGGMYYMGDSLVFRLLIPVRG